MATWEVRVVAALLVLLPLALLSQSSEEESALEYVAILNTEYDTVQLRAVGIEFFQSSLS